MNRFLLKSAALAISMLFVIVPPSRGVATPTLGNYPSISLPLSTDSTVTPDAAPINTTRINVSTSTNFRGKLEGYPTTGVVRMTDAHPAGTYTVTVKAFDSGGATAIKTFTLVVTTPTTCAPVRFAGKNFAIGTRAFSVAVGDFNGNGKQDLAMANILSGNVSVLLGNGDGTFSAATNFGAGTNPQSVVVGDFNGDGKQDLAVANNGSNNVSILSGNGDGTFSAVTNFAVGISPYSVAIGDFNGDGKQDLAVANNGSSNVSILSGDGAGHFSTATNFGAGSGARSVAVGDFNDDGKQDLAVANAGSNTVSVLLNNGMGGFGATANFDVGSFPYSVAIGEFSGDGRQDLAVANTSSNNVSILLGDGAGSFIAATNFSASSGPRSVTVGDFDGDGKQDLAVANYNSSNASILFGDGAGSFGDTTNFGVGINPSSVAVGDFNSDGKQDLAAANYNSGNVSILSRVCELTPTNAGSRKTHGSAGTFDNDLPLTGNLGNECRTTSGTNDYTMVVGFSGSITVTGNPQAQITSGTGTVGSGGASNGGMVNINGNVVTIPLTNVANAQTINVTLNSVSGGIGSVVIPMVVLSGDVNGNAIVNASDVALTKSRIGQAIDATNFRSDVNANGTINASDASLVKSKIGTGLP